MISDTLLAASQVLDKNGWTRGGMGWNYTDAAGPCPCGCGVLSGKKMGAALCLEGAIEAAVGVDHRLVMNATPEAEASRAAIAALRCYLAEFRGWFGEVASYNDAVLINKAHAVKTLLDAAKYQARKEGRALDMGAAAKTFTTFKERAAAAVVAVKALSFRAPDPVEGWPTDADLAEFFETDIAIVPVEDLTIEDLTIKIGHLTDA